MNDKIDKLKKSRIFLLQQISELSPEQLNKIPDKFNNNIIWNLTHLLCAQQGLCYLRGGQPALIPEKYIAPFTTNTKPERFITIEEIEEVKQLFVSTID